ncbi:unnamed protein product [Gulo gulo]|jgi:phosphatidylinositol glycan class O
MWP